MTQNCVRVSHTLEHVESQPPNADWYPELTREIYQYKSYRLDAHFCSVAEALIKRHPCLKEPGPFSGCYGWKQWRKYKMGNDETHQKLQECPELSVNSLKSKTLKDAVPAKKAMTGRSKLLSYLRCWWDWGKSRKWKVWTSKRNNERLVAVKMASTFVYQWQEVVSQEPTVKDFKDSWPALFSPKEIIKNSVNQRMSHFF